jgi:hypothetical protein
LDSVYRTFVADFGPSQRRFGKLNAMPTVLRIRGFRFFFYSNEGIPREPAHIHVERDRWEAKFWLRPEVQLAYNDGYNARTLRELTGLVWENRNLFERAWNEFFA